MCPMTYSAWIMLEVQGCIWILHLLYSCPVIKEVIWKVIHIKDWGMPKNLLLICFLHWNSSYSRIVCHLWHFIRFKPLKLFVSCYRASCFSVLPVSVWHVWHNAHWGRMTWKTNNFTRNHDLCGSSFSSTISE